MKNNLRVALFDKDNQAQEIWEIQEVGSRSRFLDKAIEHLTAFKDGHLRIEILKESR